MKIQQLRGIVFRLHHGWFFVDIMRVREIIRPPELNQMAGMPPCFAGVMPYRGSVVPVLDLREKFELPGGTDRSESRILLLMMPGGEIGMFVDEVTEVLTLSIDAIQPPPAQISPRIAPFFIGVSEVRERLVTLVNIDRLLSPEEQRSLDTLVRTCRGRTSAMVVCPCCGARFRTDGSRLHQAEVTFRCSSCRSLFRIAVTNRKVG